MHCPKPCNFRVLFDCSIIANVICSNSRLVRDNRYVCEACFTAELPGRCLSTTPDLRRANPNRADSQFLPIVAVLAQYVAALSRFVANVARVVAALARRVAPFGTPHYRIGYKTALRLHFALDWTTELDFLALRSGGCAR